LEGSTPLPPNGAPHLNVACAVLLLTAGSDTALVHGRKAQTTAATTNPDIPTMASRRQVGTTES